jgi:hypothetical protein
VCHSEGPICCIADRTLTSWNWLIRITSSKLAKGTEPFYRKGNECEIQNIYIKRPDISSNRTKCKKKTLLYSITRQFDRESMLI